MELNELVRSNILRLKPYSSARSEFKGNASVFLDANENPFDTGLNRYPDPLQWKLKNRIGELKGIPSQRICLGNGSDEIIDLAIRIFCEPGIDRILILPPTYGMYEVCAGINGTEVQRVPLNKDFQPDVDAILRTWDRRTKILFLCSPNNPSGNLLDESKVLLLLKQWPGLIVVDEAYMDFAGDVSFTRYLDDFPRLLVMQTLSKAWGLAGIRLGMAFAQEPLIDLFNKVKPPYNINHLTQEVALERLTDVEQQAQWMQAILQERDVLAEELAQLSLVQHIFPTDANFILIEVKDPAGIYQYLVNRGIIVRQRNNLVVVNDCLRITVGTPEENKILLEALKAFNNGQ